MTTLELIKTDVQQVQESFIQRSDIYNGKRVIIRAQKYLNTLLVCVKDLPAKEFNINEDASLVAVYINNNTL